MLEIHLRQSESTYSACRPFSKKNKEKQQQNKTKQKKNRGFTIHLSKSTR